MFQTESEDAENGTHKSLRSGDQKDASSYNGVSGSINFDLAQKEEMLLRNFELENRANMNHKKDICLQYELCEVERL